MSQLVEAQKVIFFYSFLYRHDIYTKDELVKILEKMDIEFELFAQLEHDYFPMKKYYSNEMGDEDLLSRIFYLSENCCEREDLIKKKLALQNTEDNYCLDGKRTINIDVGYVSLENMVLATGKSFSHRILLADNVYAELTYIAENGKFNSLSWTYPDYKHNDIIDFFEWSRKFLKEKLLLRS